MKIYNEVILNWNDETEQFETVYEDSFEYDGPLMLAVNCEYPFDCCCDSVTPPACMKEVICMAEQGMCLNDEQCDAPDDPVYGCTDPSACDYDSNATDNNGDCHWLDCDEDCSCTNSNGTGGANCSVVDDCGICGGASFTPYCAQTPGSSTEACYLITDEVLCNNGSWNNNSSQYDCVWTVPCDCEGNVEDCAGNCPSDENYVVSVVDCAGECGGSAVEGCDGECGSELTFDNCGLCGGDGSGPSSFILKMQDNTDQMYDGFCTYGIEDFEIEFEFPHNLPNGSTLTPEQQGLGVDILTKEFAPEWIEWCETAISPCTGNTACGLHNLTLHSSGGRGYMIRGTDGYWEGAPNIPFIKLTYNGHSDNLCFHDLTFNHTSWGSEWIDSGIMGSFPPNGYDLTMTPTYTCANDRGGGRSSRDCPVDMLPCICGDGWYCPTNNNCVHGCPGAQGNNENYQASWGNACNCSTGTPFYNINITFDEVVDRDCDCDGNFDYGCGCGNPETGMVAGGIWEQPFLTSDCSAACGSTAEWDPCNVCHDPGSAEYGCTWCTGPQSGSPTDPHDATTCGTEMGEVCGCNGCTDTWEQPGDPGNGIPTAIWDCHGELGGICPGPLLGTGVDNYGTDECDVCGGENMDMDDCGVCFGGNADDLGCGCFEPGPSGCDNTCGSTLEFDDCGVCGGDGICCDVPCACDLNGKCYENAGGIQGSINEGIAYSNATTECIGVNECSECIYTETSCEGDGCSDGVCNVDPCIGWDDPQCSEPFPHCSNGECYCADGGDQPACNCGVSLDECGICGGDNSSCCTDSLACNYLDPEICKWPDCDGVCSCENLLADGTVDLNHWSCDSTPDDCGVCGGENMDMDECGICFGTVFSESPGNKFILRMSDNTDLEQNGATPLGITGFKITFKSFSNPAYGDDVEDHKGIIITKAYQPEGFISPVGEDGTAGPGFSNIVVDGNKITAGYYINDVDTGEWMWGTSNTEFLVVEYKGSSDNLCLASSMEFMNGGWGEWQGEAGGAQGNMGYVEYFGHITLEGQDIACYEPRGRSRDCAGTDTNCGCQPNGDETYCGGTDGNQTCCDCIGANCYDPEWQGPPNERCECSTAAVYFIHVTFGDVIDGACDCEGYEPEGEFNVDLGCGCGEEGPFASSDCEWYCGSTLQFDVCGVCGGDGFIENTTCCPEGTPGDGTGNFGEPDCAGECGGSHTIDACDNCTWPAGAGCATDTECGSGYCSGGECVGDAYLDVCGVCVGNGCSCTACPENCSAGTGVCANYTLSDPDCIGICNGTIEDGLGIINPYEFGGSSHSLPDPTGQACNVGLSLSPHEADKSCGAYCQLCYFNLCNYEGTNPDDYWLLEENGYPPFPEDPTEAECNTWVEENWINCGDFCNTGGWIDYRCVMTENDGNDGSPLCAEGTTDDTGAIACNENSCDNFCIFPSDECSNCDGTCGGINGCTVDGNGACCLPDDQDLCGICNGNALQPDVPWCEADGTYPHLHSDSNCCGCDGVPNSSLLFDACMNCGGDCEYESTDYLIDDNGNWPVGIRTCSTIEENEYNLIVADNCGVCGGPCDGTGSCDGSPDPDTGQIWPEMQSHEDCAGQCIHLPDAFSCGAEAVEYTETSGIYNPLSPNTSNTPPFNDVYDTGGCCGSAIIDICCEDFNNNGLCDNDIEYHFCRPYNTCTEEGTGCPGNYMHIGTDGVPAEDIEYDTLGCRTDHDGNYNPDANLDYCRPSDGSDVVYDMQYSCASDDECEAYGGIYGEGSTCDGTCIGSSNFDIIIDTESTFGIGDNIVFINISGNDIRNTMGCVGYYNNCQEFNPYGGQGTPDIGGYCILDCCCEEGEDGYYGNGTCSDDYDCTDYDFSYHGTCTIVSLCGSGLGSPLGCCNVGNYDCDPVDEFNIHDLLTADGVCEEYGGEYHYTMQNINYSGWINQVYNYNESGWWPVTYTFDIQNADDESSLSGFPITWNTPGEISYFINYGYLQTFQTEGEYLIKVTMTDNLDITYTNEKYITVSLEILIEQTLGGDSGSTLLPWQGIDIDINNFENTQEGWEDSDNDGRPSLGCFYYDDINLSDYNFIYGKNIVFDDVNSFKQIELPNIISNPGGDQVSVGPGEWDTTVSNAYLPRGGWQGGTPSNATWNGGVGEAYWVQSTECMNSKGCLKITSPPNEDGEGLPITAADGYRGDYQEVDKNINELGWDVGTIIYVSWWQKSTALTRTGFVGIVNSGASIWDNTTWSFRCSDDSGTDDCMSMHNSSHPEGGFYTYDKNKSYSKVYTNSEINKWEKFSFTFEIPDDWLDGDNIHNLYPWVKLFALNQENGTGDVTIYYDNFEVREGWNFIPDLDVRKVKYGEPTSLTPLFKYWDKDIDYSTINQGNYKDTTAPLEIQLYFYPRYQTDDIFYAKDIMYKTYENGDFYITNLDWGDGTVEYVTEPIQLGNSVSINHSYQETGIYEITGYMLRVKQSEEGNVVGVLHNKRFVVRININEDLDNEFEYLGGEGFTFLPYKETVPITGGISSDSIYYKSTKRQLGILETGDVVNVKFKNFGDRLKTEVALVQMDEGQKNSLGLLNSFLEERVDNGETIYNGITDNFEELGQSIGDTDIGQIRYFDEPLQMYELLGFTDTNAGVPYNPRHWVNIIPEDYTMLDRSGVAISGDDITITETDPQTWTDGSYYPVLPKLNAFGKFDESLGLQGYEDGVSVENTPFGDREIWNEDDIYAYITNSEIEDDSLLIDIESEEIERNIFNDRSGNDFVGIGMSDYKVRFDAETIKPDKNKFISRINIGRKKDGAF
jgi:hypothetical protein